MPARIVFVHDDRELAEEIAFALKQAGYSVVAFDDPMLALEALEQAQSVELLITRVVFGPGKLNGVALARMMKYKRPQVRVIFTAIPEVEEHAEGLGEFMALPVRVSEIVETVERILRSQAENSN